MATDSVTWKREDHTKAKHDVLRAFFDMWVSVHSGHFTRIGGGLVRVYDGFAGPGAYLDGEPGSPRILMEALLDNPNLVSRWETVRYEFTFVEQDPRRAASLREVLATLEASARTDGRWTDQITWSVTPGRYEEHTPVVAPPPSALFLFLDPFGYKQAPMKLTGELAQQPKCDTLMFLPLSAVHRFASEPGVDEALDAFFGTHTWRTIKSGKDRPSAMLSLFRDQLRKRGLRYAGQFRLKAATNNNEYWLVGASDDPKGFESLKEAFWKVDRVNGQGFEAPRMPAQVQGAFDFGDAPAPPTEPNTAPLLESLNYEFSDDWFTVEQALQFTTERSRFLERHLRTRTLAPAEASGTLQVADRPPGTHGFTAGRGIRMRFVRPVALESPSET